MTQLSKAAAIKAKYEAERVARVEKYGLEIQAMYYDAIDAAAIAGQNITLQSGVFKLSKYPALNARVNKILDQMGGKIETYLVTKVVSEWNRSDADNDSLFDQLLKRNGKKSDLLNGRNEEALKAFQNRVDKGGLNLSKRVFNYTGQFKQEIEAGLADGIGNGRSAAVIARDMKQYLKEPDKLFRRVKVDGKLQLSKPALDYKPGQGIYRSSYKNALRLTRNETNLAYRISDSERYKSSAFIIGIKVGLSRQHPSFDMCDQLAGNYPKTFIFTSWHCNCICYQVPIMLTPEQYDKMENDLLAGKSISDISKYTDQEPPTGDHAREWLSNNKEKISNLNTTPYFLSYNESFFKK